MEHHLKNQSLLPEPQNLAELQQRLELIKGHTLGELAAVIRAQLPGSTLNGKGYAGELIEVMLGAGAKNLSEPDFTKLGIELKTVPVDRDFKPLQSTYICYAPLTDVRSQDFWHSPLYLKLRLCLYVFVLSPRDLPMAQRRIIDYYLHAMPETDLQQVKQDYDELMELVSLGQAQQITAHIGTIIQMRPKAADGKQLTDCVDEEGNLSKTRPRGFYMRRSYTSKLCQQVAGRHQLPLA